MRRLAEIPRPLLEQIENEREKQLQKRFEQYDYYCTLPVRPARMRIYRTSKGKDALDMTIVPATAIHVRPNGFLDEGTMSRDAITYIVAGTDMPFPFGHVYAGSGHVCLGNIFVPSAISRYSPQQPLETLFLHNDRNLNHGGSTLKIDKKKVSEIDCILHGYGVLLSPDAEKGLVPGRELLVKDEIWNIGSDVYHALPLDMAIKAMTQVYQVVFRKTKNNGEGFLSNRNY